MAEDDGTKVTAMGRVEYLPMGLEFKGELTLEQWRSLGETLRGMRDNVMWWLGAWWNYGERTYGEMASQEAKDELELQTGYKYQTIITAAWVEGRIAPKERVEGVSFSHHRVAAAIENKKKRAELLHEAKKESWSVREMEDACRPYKAKEPKRKASPGLFDDDRFTLAMADPPWLYDIGTTTPNRRVENHYPTMELHEICNLKDDSGKHVKDIFHDNATLLLWTPPPKIAEALTVVEEWGFEYRTQLVWRKKNIGPGYYVRQRHEILLICVKGKPGTPQPANRPPSLGTIEEYAEWMYGKSWAKKHSELLQQKLRHSEKPLIFRRMAERMYPKAVRVELFARERYKGWHAWGLDVEDAPAKKKTA